MRKEHKPPIVLHFEQWLCNLYVKHKLSPQFDTLGVCPFFLKPRSIRLAGRNIRAGRHLHIIGNREKPVSLTTWSSKQHQGHIVIGDYCLLSPGVNIASAKSITIEDSCMIAAEVNISDCDWHGVYNRTRPFRCTESVHIKKNAWIGLRAIIGKGVCVGENSVVAAGSVVVEDVPDNTVVGGNPAKVIKTINPNKRMITREFLFAQQPHDEAYYLNNQKQLTNYLFHSNSIFHWLKTLFLPSTKD